MQATADSRLLQPVMQRFRSDGAPSVPLSPHKGLRNASIIYEAIKPLPGNAILRADFDSKGKPLMVLVPGEKKDIGRTYKSSPIKAKNIDADRQDMINVLDSIAEAALGLDKPDQQSLCAAALLKKLIRETSAASRDIRAQHLRDPLCTLSNAYKRVERQKLIAASKQLYEQTSNVQSKRFKQFCAMDGATFMKLADALEPSSALRYTVDATSAVHEMKHLLRAYIKTKAATALSFSIYLQSVIIPNDVHFFAKRWVAMSQAKRSQQRMQFDTQSWAKEMDNICPLIIDACQHLPSQPMPELPLSPPEAGVTVPGSLASTEVVPKMLAARALSANEPAHGVTELNLSGEELVHDRDRDANNVPGHARTTVDAERPSASEFLIKTPFSSFDSILVSEMKGLLASTEPRFPEAPSGTYRPINLPTDIKQRRNLVEGANADVSTLFSLPKKGIDTSSVLHSDSRTSTGTTGSSTLSESPYASKTELDPLSVPNSPTTKDQSTASSFKLELELSERSQPEDDANT